MPRSSPTIISHRGLCEGLAVVENSREAFIAAANAGFQTECDVWPTADGEPVVIHDPTLDRTTFATGAVAHYSARELREFRLRTPDGAAETVPMLREVSSSVNFVEIKPSDDASLVRKVIEIMAGRDWKVLSFDPVNLSHAARLDPSVPLVFLIEDLHNLDTAIANHWTTFLDHSLLTESIARRLRKAGISIGAWGVDSEAEFHQVAPMRPDVIISNTPRLLHTLLVR